MANGIVRGLVTTSDEASESRVSLLLLGSAKESGGLVFPAHDIVWGDCEADIYLRGGVKVEGVSELSEDTGDARDVLPSTIGIVTREN